MIYDSNYTIAKEMAFKMGSTSTKLSNIYDALCEIARLKGIEKSQHRVIKSLNVAGDVKDTYSNGVITRNVGVIDLGDLNWGYDGVHRRFISNTITDVKNLGTRKTDCSCSEFRCLYKDEVYDDSWDDVLYISTQNVYVHCRHYTNGTDFKNSVKGVKLYYELETPVTETVEKVDTPWSSNFEILKALAFEDGLLANYSNSFEVLKALAYQYAGTVLPRLTNNYEAALFILDNYSAYEEWMIKFSEAYNIPLENIAKANRDYSFVTYLESSGAQYIDTGKSTGQGTFTTKVNITRDTALGNFIYGNWQSGKRYYQVIGSRNGVLTYGIQSGTLSSTGDNILNKIINFKTVLGGSTAKLTIAPEEGTAFTYDINYAGAYQGTSINHFLFAASNNGTPGYYSFAQIYNFLIKNASNDTELCLIPCLNKQGKPCMLDLKTLTELYNLGTGADFTYGEATTLEAKVRELAPDAFYGGLTFTALQAGTIGMSHYGTNQTTTIPRIEYSTDGAIWNNWYFETINVNAGDKVFFRGNNNRGIGSTASDYSTFTGTGRFDLSGNIMSICNPDYDTVKVMYAYGFMSLFRAFPVVNANTLDLSATILSNRCYREAFRECRYMTSAPIIRGNSSTYVFYLMYDACSSLSEVTYLGSSWSETNAQNWLRGVSATGTFIKNPDTPINVFTSGASGIPDGWDVEDYNGRTSVAMMSLDEE